MSLKLGQVDLLAIDTDALIEDVIGSFSLQNLGKEIDLPDVGSVLIPMLGGLRGQMVAEGQSKKASGATSSVKIGANVIQVTVVITRQYLKVVKGILNTATVELPKAAGRTVTDIVLGDEALPADAENFGVFTGLQTAVIGEGTQGKRDFYAAKNLIKNKRATGILISTGALGRLQAQFTDLGFPTFSVTDTTIENIPYQTFESDEDKFIIGDFANHLLWGLKPFTNEETGSAYEVLRAGEVTDFNGTVHNLTDGNKVALRYEVIAGVQYDDKAYFVECTFAPDAEAGARFAPVEDVTPTVTAKSAKA